MSRSIEEIKEMVRRAVGITNFPRRVYLSLLDVPAGSTVSYGELARRCRCRSAQAIGQALKRNPFAPDVPCHRVVKADGSIVGYHGATNGAAIIRKRALLEAEKKMSNHDMKITIHPASPPDYPALVDVWTSATAINHQFVDKEDLAYYKKRLPDYFRNLSIHKAVDCNGRIVGFLAVAHEMIEMLFVRGEAQGKGVGGKLMAHAIAGGATCEDVNEQNLSAWKFYEHKGFFCQGPFRNGCRG